MNPTKRWLRHLLPRLLESAVGVVRRGGAVTLCAIIAPTTLPRQPETMIQVQGGKLTSNSNGATEATSGGNLAQNPLLPLGATQNWQNARYSAAATHGAMSSPFEFSKADPAPKVTSSVVKPKKRETTTIPQVRAGEAGCISWCGSSTELLVVNAFIPLLPTVMRMRD
jgi:hypothetical protein